MPGQMRSQPTPTSLAAHSNFGGSWLYVCLGITRHLHFWQNDRGLLRATAVTRGWNGHRICVSTQSRLWRRKFVRRFCWDSNSQPFDHESGALTNKLSRLPIIPLRHRLCHRTYDYTIKAQIMPSYLRLYHYGTDYGMVPQLMLFNMRLCHFTTNYAIISEVMPLYLRLCHYTIYFAIIPHIMSLHNRFCYYTTHYAFIQQILLFYYTLKHVLLLYHTICRYTTEFAIIPHIRPLHNKFCY